MSSETVSHGMSFFNMKIKYISQVGCDGESILLVIYCFRGEISVAGPQTHAVDPSSTLKHSHPFPCVYG